jgi:magnesium transporter
MEKVQVLGEFFFSQMQGRPIYDREERRVGRLRDLALRWEKETPKITGIKYAKGVQRHIPIDHLAEVEPFGLVLAGPFKEEDLIPLHPEEFYMGKWLMDKQIIDIKGAKVVRVNDIKLYWVQAGERKYMVPVAVDIGLRPSARGGIHLQEAGKPLRLVAVHPAPGGKDRVPAAHF